MPEITNVQLVTRRRRETVPDLLDAMVEVGVLEKKFADRINELYRADIAAAQEEGRSEVLDILRSITPSLRAGKKPEGL
ncbi:hypothetical protein [Phaeobacter phage MD18]|nr:hypothetical protein [Phaeobacter phage MD18]